MEAVYLAARRAGNHISMRSPLSSISGCDGMRWAEPRLMQTAVHAATMVIILVIVGTAFLDLFDIGWTVAIQQTYKPGRMWLAGSVVCWLRGEGCQGEGWRREWDSNPRGNFRPLPA